MHEINPKEKRESKNKSKAANRVVVEKRIRLSPIIRARQRSDNDEDREKKWRNLFLDDFATRVFLPQNEDNWLTASQNKLQRLVRWL